MIKSPTIPQERSSKYPDAEVAKRYGNDMGGEDAVLNEAKQYYKAQDYRWTVELTRQVVFYNPNNKEARNLETDALEQLGYSFEGGTWRNIFLSAACELRGIELAVGMPNSADSFAFSVHNNLKALTPEYAFEYLSILIDGEKAAQTKKGEDTMMKITHMNKPVTIRFNLNNGVLHHKTLNSAKGTNTVIEFSSMDEFAEDFLKHKTENRTSKLGFLYECIDFIDGQWHIIEPLTNK